MVVAGQIGLGRRSIERLDCVEFGPPGVFRLIRRSTMSRFIGISAYMTKLLNLQDRSSSSPDICRPRLAGVVSHDESFWKLRTSATHPPIGVVPD